MTSAEFSQLLMLYSWFALAALLFFLLLIARFYEKMSGEKSRFRWFLVPVALFGIGTVRYTSIEHIIGDPLGDLFMGAAGIVLIALCIWLVRLMIVGRTPPTPPLDTP